ncbi:hypothetical protein FB451DRAFT_747453 [Mycena latifolia]|nr:hypothetical protein FB451DRAFT_747453 [Mycena latifolia]
MPVMIRFSALGPLVMISSAIADIGLISVKLPPTDRIPKCPLACCPFFTWTNIAEVLEDLAVTELHLLEGKFMIFLNNPPTFYHVQFGPCTPQSQSAAYCRPSPFLTPRVEITQVESLEIIAASPGHLPDGDPYASLEVHRYQELIRPSVERHAPVDILPEVVGGQLK